MFVNVSGFAAWGGTLNSCRAASFFVWLEEGEERMELCRHNNAFAFVLQAAHPSSSHESFWLSPSDRGRCCRLWVGVMAPLKTRRVEHNGSKLFRFMPPFMNEIFRMPSCLSMTRHTQKIKRILEIKLINSFPPKIIWRYGIYPKLFDKMSDIEFHEGMSFDVEDITNAFVIIDDLMNEVGDDKRTFKLVHERKPS
ncbi:hypothetical protein TNCV_987181 [Trichonephila clavipes]|nr:hypothetical protein TNCV_987181 [Trichonephila clavipes]